jgi:tRNA A37 threonylcarbamoyladenosine dehydratase
MLHQFSRTELLLGSEALARLSRAHVAVFGIGGVGGHAVEALARSGVGALTLVDHDRVSITNVNRQAVATLSAIGRPKVDVMAERIADINPACDVTAVQAFIDKDRVADQLGALPRPDYVVDAIDTIAQKLAIAAWCQATGLPIVSAMGGANKLDPTRLRFGRIEKTSIDPIARVMRKECRKRGIKGLMVLWSDEQPREALGKRDAIDERGFVREGQSILGTMSYFPPIMGQMLASYVIRSLVGLS